ncbi:hypothetical protein VYA_43560 (plasmid) [Vibrio alfacsensis]|uniref:hypothetical protein n=2 Tax=Vibrio alfacsensis TaxID=1074311 RepID=UPI001BEEB3B2|nr:hypothetical protein [Vibrio alfacsensis]BCN27164.1 hypothetical protein VYA_43560 [Vibrio alfacsensis]
MTIGLLIFCTVNIDVGSQGNPMLLEIISTAQARSSARPKYQRPIYKPTYPTKRDEWIVEPLTIKPSDLDLLNQIRSKNKDIKSIKTPNFKPFPNRIADSSLINTAYAMLTRRQNHDSEISISTCEVVVEQFFSGKKNMPNYTIDNSYTEPFFYASMDIYFKTHFKTLGKFIDLLSLCAPSGANSYGIGVCKSKN